MGRIVTQIRVENMMDAILAEQGELDEIKVRVVELEALVDTGATFLCLPKNKIRELGLNSLGTRKATTANGRVDREVFRGAQLTIMGRTCSVDIMELPEDMLPLVGYIPLENLDLKPDPQRQELNPAHGDKMVFDLY